MDIKIVVVLLLVALTLAQAAAPREQSSRFGCSWLPRWLCPRPPPPQCPPDWPERSTTRGSGWLTPTLEDERQQENDP